MTSTIGTSVPHNGEPKSFVPAIKNATNEVTLPPLSEGSGSGSRPCLPSLSTFGFLERNGKCEDKVELKEVNKSLGKKIKEDVGATSAWCPRPIKSAATLTMDSQRNVTGNGAMAATNFYNGYGIPFMDPRYANMHMAYPMANASYAMAFPTYYAYPMPAPMPIMTSPQSIVPSSSSLSPATNNVRNQPHSAGTVPPFSPTQIISGESPPTGSICLKRAVLDDPVIPDDDNRASFIQENSSSHDDHHETALSYPSIGSDVGGNSNRTGCYACTFSGCLKTFSCNSRLQRHLLVHTGEKPFCCLQPGCKKRFSRRDNMMQHYRTHLIKIRRSNADRNKVVVMWMKDQSPDENDQ